MKLTQAKLRQLIREGMESDPEIRKLLKTISSTLKSIDTSIDFVAASVSGLDALDLELGQATMGRTGPMARRAQKRGIADLKETAMSGTMLKDMIAEELKKLREAMPLPLDDEDDYEITQRDEDEYSRAIEMGLIPDPYGAEEEGDESITVDVGNGGPILTWPEMPEIDVFVATLRAQREVFGPESLKFTGPNADEAERIFWDELK